MESGGIFITGILGNSSNMDEIKIIQLEGDPAVDGRQITLSAKTKYIWIPRGPENVMAVWIGRNSPIPSNPIVYWLFRPTGRFTDSGLEIWKGEREDFNEKTL